MVPERFVGRVPGPPIQLDHGEPLSIPHVAIPVDAVATAVRLIAPTRWQSVAALDVSQVPPLEHGVDAGLGFLQDLRQQRSVAVS